MELVNAFIPMKIGPDALHCGESWLGRFPLDPPPKVMNRAPSLIPQSAGDFDPGNRSPGAL